MASMRSHPPLAVVLALCLAVSLTAASTPSPPASAPAGRHTVLINTAAPAFVAKDLTDASPDVAASGYPTASARDTVQAFQRRVLHESPGTPPQKPSGHPTSPAQQRTGGNGNYHGASPGAAPGGGNGKRRRLADSQFVPHSHLLSKYAHGTPTNKRRQSPHARPSPGAPPTTGWLHVATRYLGLGSPAQAVTTAASRLVPEHTAEALREWPQAMRGVGQLFRTLWDPHGSAAAATASATPKDKRRKLHAQHAAAIAAMDAEPDVPDDYRRRYDVHPSGRPGAQVDPTPHAVQQQKRDAGADPSARGLASVTSCGVGKFATVAVTVYRCGGVQVTQAQYNAILAAQALSNATSAAAANFTNTTVTVGNTTIPIIPPNIPVLNASCTVNTEQETRCACPFDYNGTTCQAKWQVQCVPELNDVGYKECMATNGAVWQGDGYLSQYSSRNDGQPPCLTLTSRTRLSFTMGCGFVMGAPVPKCNGTEIPEATRTATGAVPPFYGLEGCVEGSFSYWISPEETGRQFAMSTAPSPDPVMYVRPWNFDLLSDLTGQQSFTLSKDMIIGSSRLEFDYPKSGVPDTAWSGGRVVLETTGNPGGAAPSSVPVSIPPRYMVAEQQGYTPPPPEDEVDVVLIVMMVLLAVVVIIVAVAVWWKFGRAQHKASSAQDADLDTHMLTLDSDDEGAGAGAGAGDGQAYKVEDKKRV